MTPKLAQTEKPANLSRRAKKLINLLDIKDANLLAGEAHGMASVSMPHETEEAVQSRREAALSNQNEDTMTIDDPGLQEAIHFGESVRAETSRVFSPDESRLAWEKNDREIAGLQQLMAAKFGAPTS